MVKPYPLTPSRRLRQTRIRQAVLACFEKSVPPLAIPEITETLRQQGTSVNKTSVYRELATLERARIVAPVFFDDGRIRYELTKKEHHHHAVCLSCRTILEIPLHNEMKKIEKRITTNMHFRIKRHELEFFGLCKNCQFSKPT